MREHAYRVILKEFLVGWLDLLFKALHQERKRIKERIPTKLAWAP